jgi:hypothetical protein
MTYSDRMHSTNVTIQIQLPVHSSVGVSCGMCVVLFVAVSHPQLSYPNISVRVGASASSRFREGRSVCVPSEQITTL